MSFDFIYIIEPPFFFRKDWNIQKGTVVDRRLFGCYHHFRSGHDGDAKHVLLLSWIFDVTQHWSDGTEMIDLGTLGRSKAGLYLQGFERTAPCLKSSQQQRRQQTSHRLGLQSSLWMKSAENGSASSLAILYPEPWKGILIQLLLQISQNMVNEPSGLSSFQQQDVEALNELVRSSTRKAHRQWQSASPKASLCCKEHTLDSICSSPTIKFL